MSFDRRPSATTRSAPLRRAVKIAAVVVSVILAILVALALAASALLAGFMNIDVKERKHLAPIPIAASACPYVKLMHEAANRFQIAFPWGSRSFDARRHELPWPETKARLDHATEVLDTSISAGIPHLPARVRGYLGDTRFELRTGRRQLALVDNAYTFSQRTTRLFAHGQTAFGLAGDLIGKRCGFELRADSDTMMYPFMLEATTTMTIRTPTSRPGSPRSAGS